MTYTQPSVWVNDILKTTQKELQRRNYYMYGCKIAKVDGMCLCMWVHAYLCMGVGMKVDVVSDENVFVEGRDKWSSSDISLKAKFDQLIQGDGTK